MNKKQDVIDAILQIVVDETAVSIGDLGPVTAEDICGPSKRQNVSLSRALFVYHLHELGYSHETISAKVNRLQKTIIEILDSDKENIDRWAYDLADRRIRQRIQELKAEYENVGIPRSEANWR